MLVFVVAFGLCALIGAIVVVIAAGSRHRADEQRQSTLR
jgi:coenzyme F420-reducing hydrogenase gamma subunit